MSLDFILIAILAAWVGVQELRIRQLEKGRKWPPPHQNKNLQIAGVFEKRHDNILAKIDELPQDDFRWLNFKPSSEVRKKVKLRLAQK